jgi:hypothetical protein
MAQGSYSCIFCVAEAAVCVGGTSQLTWTFEERKRGLTRASVLRYDAY